MFLQANFELLDPEATLGDWHRCQYCTDLQRQGEETTEDCSIIQMLIVTLRCSIFTRIFYGLLVAQFAINYRIISTDN